MVNRYEIAMQKANVKSDELYQKVISKVPVPQLFENIMRNYLFSYFSNEHILLSYKPKKMVMIKSFLLALKTIYKNKQEDFAVCVQLNLFNYSLLNTIKQEKKISKEYISEVNPILGLKIISYIIAKYLLYFNKKRVRDLQAFQEIDEENLLRTLYFQYLLQLVHTVLTKKYYKSLIYFSLGSPSYGRYIYSNFHELQHGVIHNEHPAISPIRKPKGFFLIAEIFSKYKNRCKSQVIHRQQNESDLNLKNIDYNVVCFPSVTPANEGITIEYVKDSYKTDNIEFFYHPRSKYYTSSSKEELTKRIDAIRYARKVVTNPSTLIVDCYNLNQKNVEIVLSEFDRKEYNITTKSDAVRILKSTYLVPIEEEQIIFLNFTNKENPKI